MRFVIKIPKHWFAPKILVGFAGLFLGLGVLAFIAAYPTRIMSSMSEVPWRQLNADAYTWNNPKEMATAEQTLLKNRTDARSFYLLGALYEAKGDYPKAFKAYRDGFQFMRSDWPTKLLNQKLYNTLLSRIGFIYYLDREYEKAFMLLDCVEMGQNYYNSNLMWTLYERLQSPERANFHFLLAKELKKQLYIKEAFRELQTAERLSQNPQLKQQIQYYRKMQMPQHVTAINPLTRYYSLAAMDATDRGQTKQAIQFYKNALALNPDFEWLHSDIASAYRHDHQFDLAITHAKQAIALNPTLYQAHLVLGDAALDQAKYDQSISSFQQALTVIEQYPEEDSLQVSANIHNQIGYAFENLNLLKRAQQHYRLAMSSSDAIESAESDYQYAQEALQRISKEMNQKTVLSNARI